MIENVETISGITCGKWSSYKEMQSLIEHFDKLKQYFSEVNYNAPYSMDMVRDYFILEKICEWNGERYSDIDQNKLCEAIAFCKEICKRYSSKNLIEFLKVFNFQAECEADFIDKIYDILPRYYKSLDLDIYRRAIDAHPYLFLDNYEKYEKILNINPDLYETLFSDTHIDSFIEGRFDELIEIAIKICKGKFASRPWALKLRNKFISLANVIISNEDPKKIILYQLRYRSILEFLNAIADPTYYKFFKQQKQVDDKCDKWLEKNGMEIVYEVPLDDIKRMLDDPNIPYEMIYLRLTHSKVAGKKQHFYVSAKEKGKNSLIEFVTCANVKTNKNFGVHTQDILNIDHKILGFALGYLLRDQEKIKKFFNYTYDSINKIYENIGKDISMLYNEFVALAYSGINYFLIDDDMSTAQKKDIINSFTDKCIKLTEKLLRQVFVAEKERQHSYCNPQKQSLGRLLNYRDPFNPLIEILSVELMQYLSYCLITDKDDNGKEVGLSLRNIVEHNDFDWDDLNYGNGVLAMSALISTINGMCLYYYAKKQ